MPTIFLLALLASLGSLIAGLIRPSIFARFGSFSRGRIALIFGGAIIASFIGIGVTAPTPTPDQPNSAPAQREDVISSSIPAPAEATVTASPSPSATPSIQTSPVSTSDYFSVTKVVDGDTLAVKIGDTTETLRSIGIDTPETVDPRKPVQCFGVEASNRAKQLLSGKRVRLEADATQGERDKYGRLLRYVYLEDGTMFNRLMIAEGYAHEYTYDTPYKYQADFKKAEAEARAAKRGLWADNACQQSTTPTPTPTQTTTPPSGGYSMPACASSNCNCSDFSTHAYAQWFHDNHDQSDAHGLDGDHDGEVCETLP